MLGEEQDHPNFIDFEGSEPPNEFEASSGIAVFAGTVLDDYGYEEAGFSEVLGDATGETFFLSNIETASNLLTGFEIESEFEFGPFIDTESLFIIDGVLAENGFTSVEGINVNWGRWFANSELTERQTDISDPSLPITTFEESNISQGQSHFIYTDAASGILPVFTNPTQVTYNYVGGTARSTAYIVIGDLRWIGKYWQYSACSIGINKVALPLRNIRLFKSGNRKTGIANICLPFS